METVWHLSWRHSSSRLPNSLNVHPRCGWDCNHSRVYRSPCWLASNHPQCRYLTDYLLGRRTEGRLQCVSWKKHSKNSAFFQRKVNYIYSLLSYVTKRWLSLTGILPNTKSRRKEWLKGISCLTRSEILRHLPCVFASISFLITLRLHKHSHTSGGLFRSSDVFILACPGGRGEGTECITVGWERKGYSHLGHFTSRANLGNKLARHRCNAVEKRSVEKERSSEKLSRMEQRSEELCRPDHNLAQLSKAKARRLELGKAEWTNMVDKSPKAEQSISSAEQITADYSSAECTRPEYKKLEMSSHIQFDCSAPNQLMSLSLVTFPFIQMNHSCRSATLWSSQIHVRITRSQS